MKKTTPRALRVHPLRAMDTLHPAAACLARTEDAPSMDFFIQWVPSAGGRRERGFSYLA